MLKHAILFFFFTIGSAIAGASAPPRPIESITPQDFPSNIGNCGDVIQQSTTTQPCGLETIPKEIIFSAYSFVRINGICLPSAVTLYIKKTACNLNIGTPNAPYGYVTSVTDDHKAFEYNPNAPKKEEYIVKKLIMETWSKKLDGYRIDHSYKVSDISYQGVPDYINHRTEYRTHQKGNYLYNRSGHEESGAPNVGFETIEFKFSEYSEKKETDSGISVDTNTRGNAMCPDRVSKCDAYLHSTLAGTELTESPPGTYHKLVGTLLPPDILDIGEVSGIQNFTQPSGN